MPVFSPARNTMLINGSAVATVILSGLVRLIATVPVFIMYVMFDKDIASLVDIHDCYYIRIKTGINAKEALELMFKS